MRRLYLTIIVVLLCIYSNLAIAELNTSAKKTLTTIEWITIPAGEFVMGSTREEVETAYKNAKLRSSLLEKYTFEAEVPRHKVFLSEYQISRYEITNAQYRSFVEATNRPAPRGQQGEEIWKDEDFNADTHPVVGVTWFDAQAFAEWIGCSLPTEAQWERAARGTEGRTYPWGNASPKVRHHANFARRYNHPTPIGHFSNGTSPEGIYDLAGNVWEWCLDEYDHSYYQQNKRRVKQNPLNMRFRDVLRVRVIRGGAWDVGSTFLRSALRSLFYPLDSTHSIGFRVVRPRPEFKN